MSDLNHQLLRAAFNGAVNEVKELLKNKEVDVNTQLEGFTPLMLAIFQGHTEVVNLLLDCPTIDVNVKNADGDTALHRELAKNVPNDDVVDRLLDHPTLDINATNNPGATVLMFAAMKGHSLLADKIKIKKGTNINAVDEKGCTALAYAVLYKQGIVINCLLDETPDQKIKIDLDIPENSGNTPLMFAAEMGDADIILKLLNAGADPNLRNKEEKTAKEIAAENGHTTAAEIFSLHKTIKEKDLPQVIEYLVQNENYEPLKILIQGIDYNRIIEETGQTELISAVDNGQHQWVKAFIALGADVKIKDVGGYDALMHAAAIGDAVSAELLVKNGADLSATNAAGCTALMMAAGFGHKDLLKNLLDKATPEQINKTDAANYTALMHAIENNSQTEIIDSLVEKGANINNEKLMLEACKGSPDAIEKLLAAGADINTQNDCGWTPLMSAIKYLNKDAAICLIKNGADITLTTVGGHNALIIASFKGIIEPITLLLKDATLEYINAIDNDGFTARQYAEENNHTDVARQLDEKVVEIVLQTDSYQTTEQSYEEEDLYKTLTSTEQDYYPDQTDTAQDSVFVATEIIAPTQNLE